MVVDSKEILHREVAALLDSIQDRGDKVDNRMVVVVVDQLV